MSTVHDILTAALPAIALMCVGVVGAGAATVLGRRFPRDAQAALALPLGGAILACVSPLIRAGVPLGALGLGTVAAGAVFAIGRRRDVLAMLRAALVPLAVAAVALVLVAIPAAARGSWEASSFGNADIYLWVSQARSYLEGPPSEPALEFADRRSYEVIGDLHWTVGLPFGAGLASSLSGRDPAEVYGVFVVVVSVLLTLAVFFCGRAVLEWGRRRSSASALLVAGNSYLLFSAFYGWQAQLALTCFGVLAIFCFRLALDADSTYRERLLSGLFAAAAVACYGGTFGPFLAVLAVMAVVHALSKDSRGVRRWRSTARATAQSAGFAVVFGFQPLVESARAFGALASSLDLKWIASYSRALPADAIGFVPRVRELETPAPIWVTLAMASAVPLLAAGFLAARSARQARGDVLLVAGLAFFGAILVLQLSAFNAYLSMKVASYSAPILVLVVVAGFRRRSFTLPALVPYTLALGMAVWLFAVSTTVSLTQGVRHVSSSTDFASLSATSRDLADGPIMIDVEDAWRQSWAVYYLRERRVVIPTPSVFFTNFGTKYLPPDTEAPHEYILAEPERQPDGRALWRGDGLVLAAARSRAG